ncbi:6-phosphofructokinase 1 [Lachnotalea glycerini]|uniref:Pyrophosphate--fructose 6-phosphate 1-phosphotransferase n=1 Tax=Lachnotalea glycerini TaxID=1763509 RepID=A0A318EHT6_9FIRM|nr:6-phosphofructokinase [Lachnotalea glycerini]PXV86234.1 6-phosphofructokinase 1 [Lachnotalea glycerini]
MKKNLIVGQSGGPTAVINSSLYGVISEAFQSSDTIDNIYGMENGIEGFLKGSIIDITHKISNEELEAIKTTPGAYLGSCRYKLPEDLEDEVYSKLFTAFEKLNIGYFLYIGGNDSMDTVSKLARYADSINSTIRIIGIPKTIDNDLVHTDHTPGYGSAAKFVAYSVREIALDASIYDTKSVTIVEIMGRNAGWLTAASVLARKHENDNPVLIYLPETDFNKEAFISQLNQHLEVTNNLVVCVSEGLHDASGNFVCENETCTEVDNFGHKMLNGCGKYLENLVKNHLNVKVRSIELNVTQRCSSALLSLTDLSEAAIAGKTGVKAALNGATGQMVAFKRISDTPYQLTYELVDVNEICNQEKRIPLEWITKQGTDVSNDFISYVQPLIQGNISVSLEDGLPVFAYRK